MTPREGGGGTFTHRVCSLVSTFCIHSQNYPRIRTLLWEDSNPRLREGRPGPGMRLLLILGDALPPREFPRGISERALQTEADSSAVPGGGRSWERPSSRAAENGRRGGGPLGSVVWQRGALLLEVPLSLEEPVLLGPPEGLWGSRGSGWGAPVTTAASVTGSIHSSCV